MVEGGEKALDDLTAIMKQDVIDLNKDVEKVAADLKAVDDQCKAAIESFKKHQEQILEKIRKDNEGQYAEATRLHNHGAN